MGVFTAAQLLGNDGQTRWWWITRARTFPFAIRLVTTVHTKICQDRFHRTDIPVPIDSLWSCCRVYYPNDTRPTEIAYGCAEGDYCCGYDCCQEGTFFTSLFRLLVFILVMSVLGVICIEAVRWALNFLANTYLLCVPSLNESNLAQMPYCCDANVYCAFYVLNETGAAKSVKKNLRCHKQVMFSNFLV
ncbi:hypothetical protein TELCIR_09510 [Teladorsagia circumcincta]|uniref:CX domain-containing protein n=1 Tax=Teladorsagia circumcincta TaxID=45464 RepID=A0A2G9UGR2_TELCI|nr:hypothetical protein TELCIR_09510 [Teladorsagia circumcincta]